jgi:hypothetical protein
MAKQSFEIGILLLSLAFDLELFLMNPMAAGQVLVTVWWP